MTSLTIKLLHISRPPSRLSLRYPHSFQSTGRHAQPCSSLRSSSCPPPSLSSSKPLPSCSSHPDLQRNHEFKPIPCYFIKTGLISDARCQNSILALFVSANAFDMGYARRVFDEIPRLSLLAWNSMIKGYYRRNSPWLAAFVYLEMLERGVSSDEYTFPFLLKSSPRGMAFDSVEEFHAQILMLGFSCNTFVQNALIHTYSVCGKIGSTWRFFDKSSRQDVITWNAIITGYNKIKKYEESCRLFEEMQIVNVLSTPVTIFSVLLACSKLKDLKFGKWVRDLLMGKSCKTT